MCLIQTGEHFSVNSESRLQVQSAQLLVWTYSTKLYS